MRKRMGDTTWIVHRTSNTVSVVHTVLPRLRNGDPVYEVGGGSRNERPIFVWAAVFC